MYQFAIVSLHTLAYLGLIKGRGIGTAHHPRGALHLGGAGLLRSRRPRQQQQQQRPVDL